MGITTFANNFSKNNCMKMKMKINNDSNNDMKMKVKMNNIKFFDEEFLSNLKAGDPIEFNFATINYHKTIALQKLKAKKEEKLLKAGKPGSSGVAGKRIIRMAGRSYMPSPTPHPGLASLFRADLFRADTIVDHGSLGGMGSLGGGFGGGLNSNNEGFFTYGCWNCSRGIRRGGGQFCTAECNDAFHQHDIELQNQVRTRRHHSYRSNSNILSSEDVDVDVDTEEDTAAANMKYSMRDVLGLSKISGLDSSKRKYVGLDIHFHPMAGYSGNNGSSSSGPISSPSTTTTKTLPGGKIETEIETKHNSWICDVCDRPAEDIEKDGKTIHPLSRGHLLRRNHPLPRSNLHGRPGRPICLPSREIPHVSLSTSPSTSAPTSMSSSSNSSPTTDASFFLPDLIPDCACDMDIVEEEDEDDEKEIVDVLKSYKKGLDERSSSTTTTTAIDPLSSSASASSSSSTPTTSTSSTPTSSVSTIRAESVVVTEQEEEERFERYRCTEGCDFDVCSDCWEKHKAIELGKILAAKNDTKKVASSSIHRHHHHDIDGKCCSSSSSSSNQAVVESEIIRNDPFCNQKKQKGEQTEDDDIEIDEIDNNNKQKEMWISGRVKKNSRTMATSSTTHKKWEHGDSVLILDDVDMVKEMARGHGGWTSSMEKYCGQKGTVQTNALIRSSISSLRDSVRVTFDDGCSWHFNSDCLIDVREHESISANDKAQSAALNLTITYTVTPEIAPYLIEFVKDTEVEREKQFPDSSAANGTEVILSENYEDYSDASSGPLKPGEIGFIVSADDRRCQIRAEKSGRTWWYDCRALFVEGSTIDFKNFSQIKEFDITITSLFDKSLAPAGEKKKDWLQTLNIGDSLEVQVLCEMINKTTGKRKPGSVLTKKWSMGTVVERHQLERKEDVILILDVGTALIPDNKASNHDDAWRPIVVDMTQKDNDDTNINCPSISFQDYLGNKEPVLLSKKDNNNKNSTTNNMATLILDASVSPQFLQKQKTEEIAKSNPKFFENQYIFSPEQGWGMVHCYLEHKDKFVVDFNKKDSTGNESCSMISFNKTPFLHFECNYDNQSQNFPIARREDARIIGTFLKQCLTCCEHLDPKTAFVDYCYGTYKVTGDGVERSRPRHRETICKTCLMGYCSREIADGKIHVKCPCCPRDLQLRELDDRKLVSTKQYDTLMKRIKEMEETNDPDMSQFYVEGINVLLCPRCVAPIEKNGGCSAIHCWRCGNQFSEETARKVKKRKREPLSPNELKIDEARNIGLVWKERMLMERYLEQHKTKKKAVTERYLSEEEKSGLSTKEKNAILKKREKKREEENKKADAEVVSKFSDASHTAIKRALRENNYDIVGAIVDLTTGKSEIKGELSEESLLKISQNILHQRSLLVTESAGEMKV